MTCRFWASTRLFWLLSIACFLFISCQNDSHLPLVNQSKYFVESDQTVAGEFLLFFERYGGLESLGRPLTGEIEVEGWRVQYFERGRLEYHPENEAAYRVTVGWLGDLMHRRRSPIPVDAIPPADTPEQRYFPESGHTLTGDFLNYFENNGGTVRFGLPISEPFLLEDRLAQDFQSARFFWTPELSLPVTLENTGQIYLEWLESDLK